MTVLREPLSSVRAKQLARSILDGAGSFSFSKHAETELENDDMTAMDAVNVIRCGNVTEIDVVNGDWRYRFSTANMAVVVAFRDDARLRVVTGWRNQR